eukprot:CAMPEP_0119558162 /NCGR_PEP_ID=MMETSP1352-20130426/10229_1 /TAXON_ID=265584 /ORGANISM="Stauroneis constricta, Strain CCMP1120" /LENGTH=272 /DNA_ID=CAMNT_0007605429 /DNA_START=88 /DNA_END=906 /DNA_ORIENTATION=+
MASAVVVSNNSNPVTTNTRDGAQPAFDPTDAKHQVSPQFAPDKEKTWNHTKEQDGWVHAHDSLRREMKMMIKALKACKSRGGGIKFWEANCIKQFWGTHFSHVHAHHHNEDEIMVPFLKTRFVYPEKTITDHEGLEAHLDKLCAAVDGLKAGQGVANLCDLMVAYEEMMLPHLLEEEEQCLPLARAYFTAAEIAPKVQEILGHGPKEEIGSLIASMGVERWRKEFMPQEGIPGFVWFLDFKGRHKAFLKNFETPVEGVTAGVEPAAASGCCA